MSLSMSLSLLLLLLLLLLLWLLLFLLLLVVASFVFGCLLLLLWVVALCHQGGLCGGIWMTTISGNRSSCFPLAESLVQGAFRSGRHPALRPRRPRLWPPWQHLIVPHVSIGSPSEHRFQRPDRLHPYHTSSERVYLGVETQLRHSHIFVQTGRPRRANHLPAPHFDRNPAAFSAAYQCHSSERVYLGVEAHLRHSYSFVETGQPQRPSRLLEHPFYWDSATISAAW